MLVTITDGPEQWRGERVALTDPTVKEFILIALIDYEVREAVYRIDDAGCPRFVELAPKTAPGIH